MSTVKPAAVAGLFYPDDADQLHQQLNAFLANADSSKSDDMPPKALIAPHAGYRYSGQIAAQAYARLRPVAAQIRRVILLGPAHRVRLIGIAASSADFFATPFGRIQLDRPALNSVRDLPFVGEADPAFEQEHSLEVHLPFLQTLLPDFQLVPFVVGQTAPANVAKLLDRLWGGRETLIVVSSDLSHFHDYDTARQLDQTTTDNIVNLRFEQIGHGDACGRHPVNGLLYSARQRHMRAETVGLCNSGDTAGNPERVVGYGAYLLHEDAEQSWHTE